MKHEDQDIAISMTEGKRDGTTIGGPKTLFLQSENITATHNSLTKPSLTVRLQLVVGEENPLIMKSNKITGSSLIMERVIFFLQGREENNWKL